MQHAQICDQLDAFESQIQGRPVGADFCAACQDSSVHHCYLLHDISNTSGRYLSDLDPLHCPYKEHSTDLHSPRTVQLPPMSALPLPAPSLSTTMPLPIPTMLPLQPPGGKQTDATASVLPAVNYYERPPFYTIRTDHTFPNFLAETADTNGHIPSICWFLSTIGGMGVYIGACVVNQYSKTAHAYAVVQDFVTCDFTHVLFRIKIKAWLVCGDLCKPAHTIFGFLIVPAAMAQPDWSGPVGQWLNRSLGPRLVDQVYITAQQVQLAMKTTDLSQLNPEDPVTRAFVLAYWASPVMNYFSTTRDMAVAVHRGDLELPINYYVTRPPVTFDPEAEDATILVPGGTDGFTRF